MTENDQLPTDGSHKPRRRRLQFTVRTLLFLMLLVALAGSYLEWVRSKYREQAAAAAEIECLGGKVYTHPRPGRLRRWLIGPELYVEVERVDFDFSDLFNTINIVDGEIRKPDDNDCGYKPGVGKILAKFYALEELSADGYTLHNEDIAAMRGLAKLRVLFLQGANVTDACLKLMDGFPNLEYLTIDGITDQGLKDLPVLPKLKSLCITSYGVTDAGLPYLAKQPKLEILTLNSTKISDAGIPTLAKLGSLKELHMQMSDLTLKGYETLQKCLPRTKVIYFY